MFSPTDTNTLKSSHWCRAPSREAADPSSVPAGFKPVTSHSQGDALPLSHWFLEYFGFKVHILYLLVFYSGCCRLCRSNFTGGKNTVSDVLIHFDYYAFYILLFSSFLFLFFIELQSLCPAEAGGSSSALDSSQFHSITVKQTNKHIKKKCRY